MRKSPLERGSRSVFSQCEIIVERGDDRGVGLRELRFQRRIVRVGKGLRHIVLKEADDVRQLLDRDLGKDARRVLADSRARRRAAPASAFRARPASAAGRQAAQICAPSAQRPPLAQALE